MPLNYAGTLTTVQEELLSCDVLVDEPKLLVRRYVHPVMGCDHEAAPIEYENVIKIVDRAVNFDPDANRIEALIWWNVPDEAMLEEYNISLQVHSSNGQNVRQTDRHLYDNIVPWSVIKMSTADLTGGDYQVMLILYHRENQAKVAGFDLASETAFKFLLLETISLK